MSNAKREKRTPTVLESVICLLLVIGVIVLGIRMGIGSQISLFLGAIVASLAALYLGNDWKDIQDSMIRVISDSMVAILIILIVGMTIGVWIIGGTVPALIYYGLKICTPSIILPLAFILCAITSTFTGTSFGSIATMGLALVGVAIGIGVPAHIVAGAAIAGSYFGDKMSPMSDTTNMAPAMAGTSLYEHIGSMMYTTVPATIICIIIYAVMGAQYSSGAMDASNILIMSDTLESMFNITPIALIPACLVLIVSAKRVPAILGLGSCALISVVFAVLLQNASLVDVFKAGFGGFTVPEGTVDMVAKIVNRGGMKMVQDTVVLIIMACMMGGALNVSGVLNVFVEDGLLKIVKSPKSLVVTTMLYCYSILLMSGNQVLGIIMGGRTFQKAYDELDVNRKVLSRTLEDTNTIAAPLVPWSVAAAYAMGVLGVSLEYIPYTLLAFTVPIFSIACAFSGFGMWKSNGEKMWGKKDKSKAMGA